MLFVLLSVLFGYTTGAVQTPHLLVDAFQVYVYPETKKQSFDDKVEGSAAVQAPLTRVQTYYVFLSQFKNLVQAPFVA